MLQKSWLKLLIGLTIGSILVGGCATTGPTAAGPKSVASQDEYAPERGLDPNSPSFWLDYTTIYAPR